MERTSDSRAKTVGRIGVEILVNVVLPFLVYDYFAHALGDVRALLASSIPPIGWSAFEFARHRRVDALSLLVLAGIVLSLLAFLGGGSVRVLQLRENLVTGAIGLVFVGSVVARKPLVYELARASIARQSREKLEAFEALRTHARFRRSMVVMTLVWGVGLLAQTAVACVLTFALSIRAYLVVGPIVGYATFGALALWTFWFVRRQRGRGAREAAGKAP